MADGVIENFSFDYTGISGENRFSIVVDPTNSYLATFEDEYKDASGIHILTKPTDVSNVVWVQMVGSPIALNYNTTPGQVKLIQYDSELFLAVTYTFVGGDVSSNFTPLYDSSNNALDCGLVEIYKYNSTLSTWQPTANPATTTFFQRIRPDFSGITNDASYNYMSFGYSISFIVDNTDSRSYLAIGGPFFEGSVNDEGSVVVYTQATSSSSFTKVADYTNFQLAPVQEYQNTGYNVILNCNTENKLYLSISSSGRDTTDLSGAGLINTYVSSNNGTNWSTFGDISGTREYEYVGEYFSMAVTDASNVVILLHTQDASFNSVAKFYNYSSTTEAFEQLGTDIFLNDYYGYDPELSSLVIGSYKEYVTVIDSSENGVSIYTTRGIDDGSFQLAAVSGVDLSQNKVNSNIILNGTNTNAIFASSIKDGFNQNGIRTYEWTSTTLLCFVKGTRILTDDGEINIEYLTKKYTINNNKIHSVPKSIFKGKKIIVIKKDAFGLNKPYMDTIITPEHRVYEKEEDTHTIRILDLVNNETILEKDANKEVIYSVVLDNKHDYMYANGLKVETTPLKDVPHFKSKK